MLIDFARLGDAGLPRADVVVVGSGAAGMAMACELVRLGRSVLILEAGGMRHRQAGQRAFFATTRSGEHPPGELYRRRMVGGTTSIWGGRCIAYDSSDFDATHAGDGASWPIGHGDVEPFIAPALAWLDAGEARFDAAGALPDSQQAIFPSDHPDLALAQVERFSPPLDVWKAYGRDLVRRPDAHLAFNCAVVELIADEATGTRYSLRLRSPQGGERRLECDQIVLSCGGLEVPRLLLASRARFAHGVGNAHDLVGRFFMTHVVADAGILEVHDPARALLDYERNADGVYLRRLIKLTGAARRAHGLMNLIARPDIPDIADPRHGNGVLSLAYMAKHFILPEYRQRLARSQQSGPGALAPHLGNLVRSAWTLPGFALDWTRRRILARRKLPSLFIAGGSRFPLQLVAEQAPHAASRIVLTDERDPHGMPRIAIDWQTCADDVASIRTSMELIAAALAGNPVATIALNDEARAAMARLVPQGGHHIGTARMGLSPADSVTDHWGKVWGTDNLFIAGPALFPRSGAANPTLMAVALAMRSAGEIARR